MIELSKHAKDRMQERNITIDELAELMLDHRVIVDGVCAYLISRNKKRCDTIVAVVLIKNLVCCTVYKGANDWMVK